jgi:hypothetical protein
MRLVVCAHWVAEDVVDDRYLDSLGHTLQGWKQPGTKGLLICYGEGSPDAEKMHDRIAADVERAPRDRRRDLRPRAER